MVVAVRYSDLLSVGERFPAIGGLEELNVEHVDRVLLNRVSHAVRVIEGALAKVAILVGLPPRRAGVVRNEDSPAVVFDDGVDAIAVSA